MPAVLVSLAPVLVARVLKRSRVSGAGGRRRGQGVDVVVVVAVDIVRKVEAGGRKTEDSPARSAP